MMEISGTRGQDYPDQCPLCDRRLTWPALRGRDRRVDAARGQHEPGCPAAGLDPRRLATMGAEEAGREIRRRHGDDAAAD
jgi:hypothetical protein